MTCEDPTPMQQLDATVRIDAEASGKRFQGVWLELAGGTRWVIDYRATEIWRSFENELVTVTGHHWQPMGQAIQAIHFKVATMRFAPGVVPSRAVPYRSLGPEQVLRGAFALHVWPAGTRRAGESEPEFQTDDGDSYGLAGGQPAKPGPVAIVARELEPDPTYAATTGDPKLFVLGVHAHDYKPPAVMR